jgi:hypothetical protein
MREALPDAALRCLLSGITQIKLPMLLPRMRRLALPAVDCPKHSPATRVDRLLGFPSCPSDSGRASPCPATPARLVGGPDAASANLRVGAPRWRNIAAEQLDFVPVASPNILSTDNVAEDRMPHSSKLSIATALLLGSVGLAIAQGTGGGTGAAGGDAGGAAAGGTSGGAAAGADSGTSAGAAGSAAGSQDSAGNAEQRQNPQSDSRPSPGRNPNRSMSGGVAGSDGTTPMVDRPVLLPSR